jgi:hypothetical protein
MIATVAIGFEQAFMVGSFFRIGLSDLPAEQAGAGSAMPGAVESGIAAIV